jgi:hypothetical protein
MSLQSSSAMLSRAAKNLEQAWRQARTDWHDPRSRAFEQQVFAELEPTIRSALSGMAAMDQLITQARRECE